IYNHQQKNGTLDDIEKVITQQVPDLWDIESGSMHEPGYLPIEKEKEDYEYII
ncbi:6146_t:CDS:1, partial [Gigaspora rosea]